MSESKLKNNPTNSDVVSTMDRLRSGVDRHLDRFLPSEDTEPIVVHQAMRYSVFAGGKRLRPILALATGEALRGDGPTVVHLACALEMVHAFSLVHDDLPAMDDDDFRRGKPTLHKQFDEAIAILAGDALLNLAYATLAAMPADSCGPEARNRVIGEVSRALGTESGMIGGQVVDIMTQGRRFDRDQLEYIHSSKTGALITASVECAALLSAASEDAVARMRAYGHTIGLAFQIVDDILDIEETTENLGKTPGKDQASQKATYPALFGLEASREEAERLIEKACVQVDFLGARGEFLRQLARFVTSRRS